MYELGGDINVRCQKHDSGPNHKPERPLLHVNVDAEHAKHAEQLFPAQLRQGKANVTILYLS